MINLLPGEDERSLLLLVWGGGEYFSLSLFSFFFRLSDRLNDKMNSEEEIFCRMLRSYSANLQFVITNRLSSKKKVFERWNETKRNETKRRSFIFLPWRAALKTHRNANTCTSCRSFDWFTRPLSYHEQGEGGRKKFYNFALPLNYRVNHSPFFPSSLTINFKGYLKDRWFFPPLPINFMEKHCIRFVYSKLKGKKREKILA